MSKLQNILKKNKRKVIGLMSGTSADGIDACLVQIEHTGSKLKIKELGFKTYTFTYDLRNRILQMSDPGFQNLDEALRMNMVMGEFFASAALSLLKKSRYEAKQIDLIGTHGQTIRHLPQEVIRFKKKVKTTFQIGEPSVIAQRTGIVTVGDFRISDVVSGGQGAPLAPLGHFFLFNDKTSSQMVLNLGGIANFTILPENCKLKDVRGFDTGPCNVLLDNLTRRLFKKKFDRNGKIASHGEINNSLLKRLKGHKYFKLSPPKSTGREDFDEIFTKRILDSKITPEDMVASASELIVWSITDAYRRYVKPRHNIKQMIVCGGGAHNKYLIRRLAELFYPVEVITSDRVGYNPDFVEVIIFALLANQTIDQVPGSLKKVTGANKDTILGKTCLP
jgi:anhydro-N-acetylmuramic acid kinase